MASTTADTATRASGPGELFAQLDEAYRCASCGVRGMELFYRTGDVPAHSCLMLDDAEAAQRFPRRPIVLGFCRDCGFVGNVVFDDSVQDYAGQYEDQQTFSKRFREFQSGLIERLIARYGIRGKDIVEIGCGRGDFLLELCEKGGNRGIGIDPRSDSQRSSATHDVRFIPEYYSAQHWQLPCDVVCCRHTLEHLQETDRFVGQVRRALDGREGSLAFFEVPDAARVWGEAAFWDVYYEHCSYFMAGSLAGLFRRNGFEVIEVDRVFEGQYLILVARPTTNEDLRRLPIEESPEEAGHQVRRFGTQVAAAIQGWRDRLAEWAGTGRRVAVWGAGSKCVSFISSLGCTDLIDTVVDINPRQQGQFMPGLGIQVKSPEILREQRPDAVVIMNPVYRDEIARQLAEMRVTAELVCVE